MRFQTNIPLDQLDRSVPLNALQQQATPQLAQRLQVLARLPESDRALLELSAVHRLSHRQIADRLNLSPGTVSRRLNRLRHRLSHPVVRAIARAGRSLSPALVDLAIDHFVLQLPSRPLSQKFDLNRHQLKSQLDHLTGWAVSINRREEMAVQ